MNYESTHGVFPPGQMKLTTKPPSGFTLFVNLLPFMEQQPLYNGWNFSNGFDNLYGSTARSATIIERSAVPGRHHPGEPDPERHHLERVVRDHQLRRQRRVAVASVLGGHVRRDLLLHRPGRPRLLPGEDLRRHGRALQHALLRRAESLRPELRHLRSAGMDVLLADDGDVGLVGVVERRLRPVGRGGEHIFPDQLQGPDQLWQPGRLGLEPERLHRQLRGPTGQLVRQSASRAGRISRWSTARCGSSSRRSPSRLTTPWVPGPAAR